ncbi:MAG: leucine-rich repeat protein [Bacteroidales bacterium]|nr:leucine-rich repeat protein [Bacteroidales bacterium]
MKRILFILSALAALFACTPQEMEITPRNTSGSEITLHAFFEEAPATKTTLVDSTKVYWLPGDEIAVFSGNSPARFTTGIKEKSAQCDFTGTIAPATRYVAFYPFSAGAPYDGKTIKAALPSAQTAADGNVTAGYLLSAGMSSADGNIQFRNIVSGICFSLATEGVRYVELCGNDGESIAGGIQVKIDENTISTEVATDAGEKVIRLTAPEGGTLKPGINYYIVCAPTVFGKGLTLELFKGEDESAAFRLDGKVELKRSGFGHLPLVDEGLAFKGPGFPEGEMPADNEIWYTTSDRQPLVSVNDQGANKLESNTFSNDMGILRFSGPLSRFEAVSNEAKDNGRITGLLLPDCVEDIGYGIFWDMLNIKEFRIPSSLRQTKAFTSHGNLSLERLTGHHVSEDGHCVIIDGTLMAFAPAGITSYEIPSGVTRIAEGALALAKELRSAVIPEGVTDMERGCFEYSGLESVTIPASVKAMDHYSFRGCYNLKNLLGDSHFISSDKKYLYDTQAMMPMVLFFFAGRDDESYEIPEGIMTIENYAFERCVNLKCITFPASLGYIAGDAFDGSSNLVTLEGSHITVDHKGFINEDGALQFLVPAIGEDYVVPDEVTRLGDNLFSGMTSLRSVTMGDQVTSVGNYVFAYCPSLKTVTLSANLISIGYNPFQLSQELESVYFRSILPPTCADIQETGNPKIAIYVPSKAFRFYTVDTQWQAYWDVMKLYDYDDLPEPDYYMSSDYSKEGEVTVYQKASEGNGIDIVFMGDGYSDRQVAGGMYRGDMEACVEEFFAVEPYKSFRKLFNIYFVTTVSATEGYERGGRSLGTYRGFGTFIGGNDAKCLEYARKAVGEEWRMDEVLVVVCGNQDLSGTIYLCGTCNMKEPANWEGRDYACGAAVTYFTKLDEKFEKTGETLRHEAGGHGFAKLADEYHYSGSVSAADKDLIESRAPYMWYSNVDVTSDPAKVKWARFLQDPRYGEEVGMYEGGFTYLSGVWRPSENSVMNDNQGGFNAPSRYTIWYRIHKLAYGSEWSGTYEDFAAYDAINR